MSIRELILDGHSVEYKGISICTITRRTRMPYQVHSDNSRCKFSQLYENLDDAIEKFNLLKRMADKR